MSIVCWSCLRSAKLLRIEAARSNITPWRQPVIYFIFCTGSLGEIHCSLKGLGFQLNIQIHALLFFDSFFYISFSHTAIILLSSLHYMFSYIIITGNYADHKSLDPMNYISLLDPSMKFYQISIIDWTAIHWGAHYSVFEVFTILYFLPCTYQIYHAPQHNWQIQDWFVWVSLLHPCCRIWRNIPINVSPMWENKYYYNEFTCCTSASNCFQVA